MPRRGGRHKKTEILTVVKKIVVSPNNLYNYITTNA